MDRKLQRHRADSLRQHGFLVIIATVSFCESEDYYIYYTTDCQLSKQRNHSITQYCKTFNESRQQN